MGFNHMKPKACVKNTISTYEFSCLVNNIQCHTFLRNYERVLYKSLVLCFNGSVSSAVTFFLRQKGTRQKTVSFFTPGEGSQDSDRLHPACDVHFCTSYR